MIDISKKSFLVDTNIWIYYFDTSSPFHPQAYDFFKVSLERQVKIVVAQQNFIEFVNTLTKDYKKSFSESVKEAEVFIRSGEFRVIFPLSTSLGLYKSLIKNGHKGAFDLYLAATAIDNGVDCIVTNDPKGFKGIKGLEVFSLEEIVKEIEK